MKRSTALSALALSAAAAFTAGAYQFSFGRSPLARPMSRRGRSPAFQRSREEAAARMRRLPHRTYTIVSARGVTLKGFYYPCGDSTSDKVAFLVHGFHSEHREAAGLYLRYYHDRGFDVFCCDNTAAGESGGRLVGFGVFERADCLRWLEFLQKTLGPDTRFLLHGFSMGGATVLGMGPDCPACVKAIVADSAFTDAARVLRPKMGVLYHPLHRLNRLVAGYSLDQTDVRSAVSRSPLPTLFVHGKADKVVPFSMGEELFALHPGPKDALFLPAAGHVETMFAAPEVYGAKLDEFLRRHTNFLT